MRSVFLRGGLNPNISLFYGIFKFKMVENYGTCRRKTVRVDTLEEKKLPDIKNESIWTFNKLFGAILTSACSFFNMTSTLQEGGFAGLIMIYPTIWNPAGTGVLALSCCLQSSPLRGESYRPGITLRMLWHKEVQRKDKRGDSIAWETPFEHPICLNTKKIRRTTQIDRYGQTWAKSGHSVVREEGNGDNIPIERMAVFIAQKGWLLSTATTIS